MLALLLMFAVGATAGALSFADARPAMADDGGDDDDDDGRGDDDDDDGRGDAAGGGAVRGGDDDDGRGDAAVGDKDRVVPQGGVQTGTAGMASGTTTVWTLGGAGLLAGVGAVATWLLSRRSPEDL